MTAKDIIAEKHLGLVHSCCKRFAGKGIEYDELYSAGCLGLSKAINKFDESLGYQFSTYAFPVIMGEIKRLFRDGGSVKVSRAAKELAIKINKLNNESKLKNGKELSVFQLADILNVNCEKIVEALNCSLPPLSLTAEHNDENGSALEIPIPDIQYEISERLSLQQAIHSLDERDKTIITLRYFQNKTQTQTAALMNMTQVQISRREKKILAAIRQKMMI